MHADKPLSGQSAIVTGASRGIGFAIARRLGQMGARVALCARGQQRLEAASSKLRQAGIETLALPADVSRAAEVSAVAEAAAKSFGALDILVNNAGIGRFAPVHEFSEADWDALLDTNLKGVFLMSRAVIPGMIARGRGHIINISSLAGKNFFAGGSVYCASKWGLLGLTYSMAEDLRGYGIRVAAICPGSVATDFSPHPGKKMDKILQPEDVAHAVAMILTEAPQSFISEVLLRPTKKP
ncbi:MAG TPA: SDR family NAD(P)-dependent oxidoreductase [Candidatus Acidoferrales bacterium]|nr:SDR family NAD(P)-dependent oxidoreductase [Candidatus Acidoferrales bacterium]